MNTRYFTVLLFFIASLCAVAQEEEEMTKGYLFEDFQRGQVVFKNGSTSSSLFNYDLLGSKILFKNGEEVMELANPNTVSHININGRVFQHIKSDVFYEKVKAGNTDLYVLWKSSLVSEGKNAGYGTKSQTSAVDNVSHVYKNLSSNKLSSSETFKTINKNNYYVNIKGKYKQFNSLSTLANIFKNHEEEIKNGLKDEKLNFRKINDVKHAVSYCSQFVEE